MFDDRLLELIQSLSEYPQKLRKEIKWNKIQNLLIPGLLEEFFDQQAEISCLYFSGQSVGIGRRFPSQTNFGISHCLRNCFVE